MNDDPTFFKNETVPMVSTGLKVLHDFTLPYCPWSKEAVEKLGHELLLVIWATLSELTIDKKEWPDLFPSVPSILIYSTSPQRGNFAPITAFMGPKPPIATFLYTKTTNTETLTKALAYPAMNVEKTLDMCHQLNLCVQSNLVKHRKDSRDSAS